MAIFGWFSTTFPVFQKNRKSGGKPPILTVLWKNRQKWWKTTTFNGFLKKPRKWVVFHHFHGFFEKPEKWWFSTTFSKNGGFPPRDRPTRGSEQSGC
jgi:hypothetical protein